MTSRVEKQTILVLSTSSGPGGAERVISTLSAALDKDNFRVIVGLFRSGWLQTECERLCVETRVIPLGGPFHLKWFLACVRLIRKEKVSLIHAHEFSAIVYGWVVSRLLRIPFVGTIHGKNYFWEKGRRRLAYRVVSRSGQLVVVSEDLKKFVADKVGIQVSQLRVIYNGIEPASPISEGEVDRCRAELGLKASDLIIGTVGSLYPVKGHRYLLEAMPDVLAKFPNAVLLVVGRGELEVSLKEQAKQLGIAERVRFLGMRQDVPRLLAVMHVFVLPSLSEGLSVALLEALASGKPVLATRVGGNTELVKHGETGLLVSSEDSRALMNNLIMILGDCKLRHRLSSQAADKVHTQFSLQEMKEQYREVYWKLLCSAV